MAEDRKYYQIASLEKGLTVLEAIVRHGRLTVTEVAKLLGINRASSHRFITTLRDLGYVTRNPRGDYEATFKLLELGMAQADKFEIRRLAKPVMRDLAAEFDETVNLGILDRGLVVYLDKVESREMVRMYIGVGTTCPPHATGLGKAMAAFLPPKEFSDLMSGYVFEAMTPNTITTLEAFEAEMAVVRSRGYAVDNEELSLDLYCVAAPVFDLNGFPSYALSVSGPAGRLKRVGGLPGKLREVTRELSRKLGLKGEPGS